MGLADPSQARSTDPRGSLDDGGYILVVLLISIAVSAVWMGAALPSWRQQVIREREAELIFRGESYARAIYLYRQKNGQNLPPNVDVLISGHYLRRKYLDPITGKEFLYVQAAAARPGGIGAGFAPAGISGVRSTSNDASIRTYNNQTTYSQWAFDFTLEQLKAGAGTVPGTLAPGGRVGGPAGTPAGRGAGELPPLPAGAPRGGATARPGGPGAGTRGGVPGSTGPGLVPGGQGFPGVTPQGR